MSLYKIISISEPSSRPMKRARLVPRTSSDETVVAGPADDTNSDEILTLPIDESQPMETDRLSGDTIPVIDDSPVESAQGQAIAEASQNFKDSLEPEEKETPPEPNTATLREKLVGMAKQNMLNAISYCREHVVKRVLYRSAERKPFDEKEYRAKRGGDEDHPFAIGEYENTRYRQAMEDSILGKTFSIGDRHFTMTLVCDGHGIPRAFKRTGKTRGQLASAFASTMIQKEFEDLMKADPTLLVEEALFRAVRRADRLLCEEEFSVYGGTTASILLIEKTADGPRLVVGNVGDSRVVGIRKVDGKATGDGFTIDHSAKHPEAPKRKEVQRIVDRGGYIRKGRVWYIDPETRKENGGLAMTKSLGDRTKLDENGKLHDGLSDIMTLIPEDVKKMGYDAAIVACDGVWDVISADEAAAILYSYKNVNEGIKALITEAIARGTKDNVSAMMVKIKPRVTRKAPLRQASSSSGAAKPSTWIGYLKAAADKQP